MRLYLLFSFISSVLGSVGCRSDLDGSLVDSWVSIKLPRGTEYLYSDVNSPSLKLSSLSMNDTTKGSLTNTVSQLWSSETAAYTIWNDEVPNDVNYSFTYGHTKGLLAFDSEGSGFLLIHSIPAYPVGPNSSSRYIGLGGNAYTYAQSLLCLSVSADTLNSAAYKFLLNRPQIYDSLFPDTLASQYGNLSKLVKGEYTTAKLCAAETLKTVGGMEFRLFAKTSQWNNDLYSACVAPDLQSSLWVESWIRGSAEGPSCPTSGYDTLDIQGLKFSSEASWTETNDHSKWALANTTVCIGDINRMTTQYSRGGGTACFQQKDLANQMRVAVTGTDSCSTV